MRQRPAPELNDLPRAGGIRPLRFRAVTGPAVTARTLMPFRDETLSRVQSERIRVLIAQRCKELPAPQFVEMMRAAIEEDEWLLYAHGALMGFAGGLLHLWLFGAAPS